jgi:hypothetical protein
MKTLLLFIGTVLRSRIIQRKGLGAIPAIYKLVRYWWTWTSPQPDLKCETALCLSTKGGYQPSLLAEQKNPVAQS